MLIDDIEALVRECGNIMLNADRSAIRVTTKGGEANFVTDYDMRIQQKLKAGLLELLPRAQFIGEEDELQKSLKDGYVFIVDPIDGTTNFIKDYHMSCISVGLVKDGKPYIGVVHNPYFDETFTAKEGEGAFLNGDPIRVSDEELQNGIVLLGTSPYYSELREKALKLAGRYMEKALDIRRSGSAAIDLCTIACGRAELFFELKLSPWDYAAGALIVKEAGGYVCQPDGSDIVFDRPCGVVAANMRASILL